MNVSKQLRLASAEAIKREGYNSLARRSEIGRRRVGKECL